VAEIMEAEPRLDPVVQLRFLNGRQEPTVHEVARRERSPILEAKRNDSRLAWPRARAASRCDDSMRTMSGGRPVAI